MKRTMPAQLAQRALLCAALFLVLQGCSSAPEPTVPAPTPVDQAALPESSGTGYVPKCDFALPDDVPDGARPIGTDAFTPAVLEGLQITITNAWQITETLQAGAGHSPAGAGALVLLPDSGDPQLLMLGARGAPGPASILSVRGDFIVLSQGLGYLAVDYTTGDVFQCHRSMPDAVPVPDPADTPKTGELPRAVH